MIKIALLSPDSAFAEDFAEQLRRFLPNIEVFQEETKDVNLFIIDADAKMLQKSAENYKDIPIVFLSSGICSTGEADVVITKPFHLAEFLHSLKNNTLVPKIRRKECLNFKEYSFYPVKKEIVSSLNQAIVKLTEKEVNILKYLYLYAPAIISKEELLENVWGYNAEASTHTVETHIYRLRQKVEENGASQLIITENNGYRLNI